MNNEINELLASLLVDNPQVEAVYYGDTPQQGVTVRLLGGRSFAFVEQMYSSSEDILGDCTDCGRQVHANSAAGYIAIQVRHQNCDIAATEAEVLEPHQLYDPTAEPTPEEFEESEYFEEEEENEDE